MEGWDISHLPPFHISVLNITDWKAGRGGSSLPPFHPFQPSILIFKSLILVGRDVDVYGDYDVRVADAP